MRPSPKYIKRFFRMTDFFSMCAVLRGFLPTERESAGIYHDIRSLHKE